MDWNLAHIDSLFPAAFSQEERARAKTAFLKNLSLAAHEFYGGKVATAPKCAIEGLPWFNVWYTPGVSKVSTTIRDASRRGGDDAAFALSNRGNLVAVVSDSTRVLGDGDCTPSGGLGVMEGKALLMKYLGGIDAVALCIDSRGPDGRQDPRKIIDFVRMAAPSFGAVNLEDISSPACYKVLDSLRETCPIPVWHDDAQGTACVTLAALINALHLAGKSLEDARIVFLGAGAANTSIARLLLADGARGEKCVMFDGPGRSLHAGRADLEQDALCYRAWELCQRTNPRRLATEAEACKGADVLIAASTPGPDTVKRAWVRSMAAKAIVFACANPVPEIWPYAAREEGAFIVATGRGDFPNQVNNSVCFPGILKGALLVRARKITDGMAIRCAHSIADFARRRGLTPDNIIATMAETDVFAHEAADVAEEAIREGVARRPLDRDEVYRRAWEDIRAAQKLAADMKALGHIKELPANLLEKALEAALAETTPAEDRHPRGV